MNINFETLSAFLLTLLYFQSALNKNLTTTPKGLQERFIKSIPLLFYKFIIVCVILLELIAPIIIVYSTIDKSYRKEGKCATLLLILFTIVATLLYHKPLTLSFYSHLSIIGGLIALYLLL